MGIYDSMYGAYMAPYMSHTLLIYLPYNSGIYSDIYVSGHIGYGCYFTNSPSNMSSSVAYILYIQINLQYYSIY